MPAFTFLVSGEDLDLARVALRDADVAVAEPPISSMLPMGGGPLTPADSIAGSIEAPTEEAALEALYAALPDDGFEVRDIRLAE